MSKKKITFGPTLLERLAMYAGFLAGGMGGTKMESKPIIPSIKDDIVTNCSHDWPNKGKRGKRRRAGVRKGIAWYERGIKRHGH